MKLKALLLAGLAVGAVISFSCSDDTPNNPAPGPAVPTVHTLEVSDVTETTASSGGDVLADGGAAVIAKGVCWSTASAPTVGDAKTSDGDGTGSFVSSLTGLTAGTPYHVRAYATNSAGTGYGNAVSFTTVEADPATVSDVDGNVYRTIRIGSQLWMAENLKVTRYNNGDSIPNVTGNAQWAALTSPAYCWYQNDAVTNRAVYGALYNWYAVDSLSNGNRSICPTGWHIPTEAEWTTLATYLGGSASPGER